VFSSLARQVVYLQDRQSSIHSIRESYKDQLQTLMGSFDVSANLDDALEPILILLKKMKERCEKDDVEYFKDLKLQKNGNYPIWLLDLINNLISFGSDPFCLIHPDFPFKHQLSSFSHQEIIKFYNSISKSPKQKGVFELFNNVSFLIKMEGEKGSVEGNSGDESFTRITPCPDFPLFSFDFKCTHFSPTEIQNKFNLNVEEFVSLLDPHFREKDDKDPEYFEKHIVGKFPKNSDQALEYGKIEIPYHVKCEFWKGQVQFLSSIPNLFEPHNLSSSFIKSWNNFILKFELLFINHYYADLSYPQLKINFFAGIQVSKKYISNENEQLVLKTINSLFRLIERSIESNANIKDIRNVLKKTLILPLLFSQTKFKKQSLVDFLFRIDDNSYYTTNAYYTKYNKSPLGFSKCFESKNCHEFEVNFAKVFEKVKRFSNAENLPFDPVLAIEFDRKQEISSINSHFDSPCLDELTQHIQLFRNPIGHGREKLLISLEGFRSKLLEYVTKIDPRIAKKYRNVRFYCRWILTIRDILITIPF
jgi:hypothetical protein